eukprot:GGOE01000302.1.p1 GENE.GGOE01000302.1~~GGOE01000302.1.p1  ORF type:complete len:524 (+),score=61.55 GGOE01000302.1:36-1607(+)
MRRFLVLIILISFILLAIVALKLSSAKVGHNITKLPQGGHQMLNFSTTGNIDDWSRVWNQSTRFDIAPSPNLSESKLGKGAERLHLEKATKSSLTMRTLHSLEDLARTRFVVIQAPGLDFLAAVNQDFGQPAATMREKIWRVFSAFDRFQFQSYSGGFLSVDERGILTTDRRKAHAFETFAVMFSGGKAFIMTYHGTYLAMDYSTRRLNAAHPIRSTLFTIGEPVDCNSEQTCWNATYPPLSSPRGFLPIVLFGSPKEAEKLALSSHHDNQQVVFNCWSRLQTAFTIIYTKDQHTADSAKRQGLHVQSVFSLHPTFLQPTYKDLFDRAFSVGKAEAVVYSNGDILYTHDLLETISFVHTMAMRDQRPPYKFMVVGQRVNYVLPLGVTLGKGWESQVLQMAQEGQLFQANAQDYFAVSRALWEEVRVPDFVVGGTAFDNWFTGHLVRRGFFVVDGSASITAVHLNHGHSKQSHKEPKSQHNTQLALQHGGWGGGSVVDCRWFTARDPSTGDITLWDRRTKLLWH